MSTALVFPGQGSQSPGMGRELFDASGAARAVFEEVDEALGEKLSDTIFNGPEEKLTLTPNTQPALMAVSIATLRALEEKGFDLAKHTSYVAGHSLGEYSALAASGALSLFDAAKLLRIRGDAMQRAVPVGEGAMAALLGLDWDAAEEVCRESADGDVCTPANDNAPGQVVISGARAAVERACEIAKGRGAKRALILPVSAPFHCSLMQPAADAMRDALAGATINTPAVPLVANVTARPVTDPDEIRDLLVRQVTGTVRWRESVMAMKSLGVNSLVEVGAGKVLAGLVKRIDKEMDAVSISTPDDVEAFTGSL